MQIHVGASLDRPPGPKYLSALSFAELRFPSTRPKPKTLERWRTSVGESFTVSIVAPKSSTEDATHAFKVEELGEGLDWLGEATRAAAARAVVIPTRRAISTGQRDRDKLARYFDAIRERNDALLLVWQPGGLWDLDLAIPQAEKFGVTLAVDPLEADLIPEGPLAYLRLVAMGARPRITPGMSYEVIERLREHPAEEVFVAVQSERSVREAAGFAALLAEPEPG